MPAQSLHLCLYGVLLATLLSWAASQQSYGEALHFQMVYKYSEGFRAEMQRRGIEQELIPEVGSLEHHKMLAHNDRHRHSHRRLLNETIQYSLAPSNETYLIPPLGALHYTFVTIGTPKKSFFVALDTGSDLLWVPCDCVECAEANWASYGITIKDFAIYSSSKSNTSKVVSCDDVVCATQLHPNTCISNETCTYNISYLSSNTSSSGIIVQDVISLNSEDESNESITTPIYFGCGRIQTGLFKLAAVDGLFGLGPDAYSVPSTLFRNKIVPNVFSMCFQIDYSGRLVFGKTPSSLAQQTPLIPHDPSVYYILEVENLLLAGSNISTSTSSKWVFDTGTSYTIMPTSIVVALGELINENTGFQSTPIQISEGFILKYCWNLTTTNELDMLSNLTIVFGGGGSWDIKTLYLQVIGTYNDFMNVQHTITYTCLGIIDDPSQTIIGLNFMAGYEYFFDQGSMTFSWAPSDCYTFNDNPSQISPAPSPLFSVPPSIDNLRPESLSPSTRSMASSSSISKSKLNCIQFMWLITIIIVATISLTS